MWVRVWRNENSFLLSINLCLFIFDHVGFSSWHIGSLFIYFWPCWVFIVAHRFSIAVHVPSLAAVRGSYPPAGCASGSARWVLLLWSTGFRAHGLSCPAVCGILVLRLGIKVPCVGRWILNHWPRREVLSNGNSYNLWISMWIVWSPWTVV